MAIFNSYVSLPEGSIMEIIGYNIIVYINYDNDR